MPVLRSRPKNYIRRFGHVSALRELFRTFGQLNQMEAFYPLHAYVCDHCFLVQLEEYVSPEHIFSEYAYFSSYAGALLQNAKSYTDDVVVRFHLNAHSQVIDWPVMMVTYCNISVKRKYPRWELSLPQMWPK